MRRNQFTAPILIDEQGEGTTLERLSVKASGESYYDENWLQKLLYNHPEALPISEIDQSYLNLVPICREMNTSAGPVDVLYATPEGKLIILEAKLWRNPEARRKVIGQILDYAKELGSWSYEDLQREISRALRTQEGKSVNLYDILANKYPELSEANFIDSVSRNLKRGEFLLLIVGDGIREGVAAIAEFMENHGTLHFTFGLVEMAIYKVNDKSLLIHPRVIAQTVIVKRTVITLETEGLISKDASEMGDDSPKELTEIQKFYYDFWSEFIAQLKLDDPGQPLPNVTKQGNIFLSTPAKSNAWITIYFFQKTKEVGLYLTFPRGSMGNILYEKLIEDKQMIERDLGILVNWKSADGKHLIEVHKVFPDLYAPKYREPIKLWLAEHANLFVNVFRPRIERIMEEI
jgi:hypothetical protein